MIRVNIGIFSFILFVFITANTTSGQSVYGFRGEDRTGIYPETGLLTQWPNGGPPQLWEVSGIGMGYSSATVTEDAIYITGMRSGKDVVTAFTLQGKKKWDVEYGSMLKVQNYPESRCTPTVSGDKIFLVSGSGELSCVSINGKLNWTVDVFKKYNSPTPRFGISESPVVVDNKVIMTPGGNVTTMVAFNVENGNEVWRTESLREEAQYVNPLLIERGGKKIIVTHTATYIFSVNAADGTIVWKFDFKSVNGNPQDGRNYIQTPIYKDGYLFAANGYGQTSAKIRIFDNRDPELVWKNSEFNPHVGGMVLIGNYLYGSTHDNNSMGRWICVDWTTGKTMWITRWNNKGSVIAAEGLLYIYEERWGNVALVKPDSQKLNIISEFQVNGGTGPYWAHPVIKNGVLYLRHGDMLFAYNIKK